MDVDLIRDKLTQAKELLTLINSDTDKGYFKTAIDRAKSLNFIFQQIAMRDLLNEVDTLIGFLRQGNVSEVQRLVKELDTKVDAKLSEATPHLRLAREIKCPYCHANILTDAIFCSQCRKELPK